MGKKLDDIKEGFIDGLAAFAVWPAFFFVSIITAILVLAVAVVQVLSWPIIFIFFSEPKEGQTK